MRISRHLRLTATAASLLLGVGVLAGPSSAAPAERPAPAGSAVGGVSAASTAARSGHIAARINDVEIEQGASVSAVHARTIDLNRFGYAFGQQNAKFTLRTRDLRNVANRRTVFSVVVTARSTAGTEEFYIQSVGSFVAVYAANGYQRICREASVARDAARNTVTLRAPMRCISGRTAPSSMQAWASTMLADRSNEILAWDASPSTPRVSVRR